MTILQAIKKGKSGKIVSLMMTTLLLGDVFFPTLGWALTGGPSQPEVESFEPVSTNQMVDLFSGDFNYNIPLLTVPGPNGGYPINIAYHSGVGMEQEASWVGLGWNINAGSITRQMRGLPDDFKGAKVKKKQTTKPTRTYSFGIGAAVPEVWGYDPGISGGAQIHYNNYKGVGIGFNTTLTTTVNIMGGAGLAPSATFDFDPYSGVGLTTGLGLSGGLGKINTSLNFSKRFSAREGLQSTSFTANLSASNSITGLDVQGSTSTGAGVTFNPGSTFVPSAEFPTENRSYSVGIKPGFSNTGAWAKLKLNGHYSESRLKDKSLEFDAYGYLYAEHSDEFSMMDLNRDKYSALSKESKFLPIPVFSNDIFQVKAQGMGGVFRPYRSEVGLVHDPKAVVVASPSSLSHELELAAGNGIHVGDDVQDAEITGHSGVTEKDGFYDSYSFGRSKDVVKTDPYFEPYYFKASGEQTGTSSNEANYLLDEDPKSFTANLGVNNVGDDLSRHGREKRGQNMSVKTIGELALMGSSSFPLYSVQGNGYNSYADWIDNEDEANKIEDQIGELSVINPDGMLYEYGLPVFNNMQKDVSFSVKLNDSEDYNKLEYHGGQELVNYSHKDASLQNGKSADHFYSETIMPKYAHSYMLTAVYSPDYVDLTGNGPTEDDLGYYVKFSYKKAAEAYKWRIPFYYASYAGGIENDPLDDKANYSYGTKQLFYLDKIESKTHVALFTTSDNRDDAYEALGEHATTNGILNEDGSFTSTNVSDGLSMSRLDRIDLYSKNAEGYNSESLPGNLIPIKTVHFAYKYSLCKGIVNAGQIDSGKLTLDKLYFTYGNNLKGALSPYVFDYTYDDDVVIGGTAEDDNPEYSIAATDRWGNYKKPNHHIGENKDIPYVYQGEDDYEERDRHAGAWCMKSITMPSGGKIKVEYESDDYSYVQDQKAKRMVRIAGLEEYNGNDLYDGNGDLTKIFFELDVSNTEAEGLSTNDILPYVEDMQDVFFKAYMKIKNFPSAHENTGTAHDYVEGYLKYDPIPGNYGIEQLSDGQYYGFIIPEQVSFPSPGDIHPFQKAAIQHFKLNRTDLAHRPNVVDDSDIDIIEAMVMSYEFLVDEIEILFSSFYEFAKSEGYGNAFKMSNDHPSFLRLKDPDGRVYGGGHRVKKIEVLDSWASMEDGEDSFSHGQEYIYEMPDGTSSGVAESEPLSGAEESSLRYAYRYNRDDHILNHPTLYYEGPVGETYYPGAGVGYRRVLVQNIHRNQTATVTGGGRSVTNYYTAKDFPVVVDYTPLTGMYRRKTEDVKLNLEGDFPVGIKTVEKSFLSQGISVWLNNMHGQIKSEESYRSDANLFYSELDEVTNPFGVISEPVSKTSYTYDTEEVFQEGAVNKLDNKVKVFVGEDQERFQFLGKTTDYFIDSREDFMETETNGKQFNLDILFAPFSIIPLIFPRVDAAHNEYRTNVNMKLINKTGILTKVEYEINGAKKIMKHEVFDAETGAPLLTSITNEFDNPVYDYNMPAHWYYEDMNGAYKNAGAALFAMQYSEPSTGQIQFDNLSQAQQVFTLGDEVLMKSGSIGELFWVAAIEEPVEGEFNVTFQNANSTTIAISGDNDDDGFDDVDAKIMRSGNGNQQSLMAGYIKFLNLDTNASIFEALSDELALEGQSSYLSNELGGVAHMGIDRFNYDCGGILLSNTTYDYPIFHAYFVIPDLIPVMYFLYSDEVLDDLNLQPYSLLIHNVDDLLGEHFIGIIDFPTQFITDFTAGGGTTNPLLHNLDNYDYEQLDSGDIRVRIIDPIDGTTEAEYICSWASNGDYFDLAKCKNVLDANAIEYSDQIAYDYTDVSNNNIFDEHPYRYGQRGTWKAKRTNLYQVDRKQSNMGEGDGFLTDVAQDGTYDNFVYFNWEDPEEINTRWQWTQEISRISPYGFELENRDVLNRYSSALYGYDHSLAVAVGSNTAYYELGFDGFEDHPTAYEANHGHITISNAILTNEMAHTGSKSLRGASTSSPTLQIPVVADGANEEALYIEKGKSYLLSVWQYGLTGYPLFKMDGVVVNFENESSEVKVEGWQKMDYQIVCPSTGMLTVEFKGGNESPTYYDDLRVQPYEGSVKSYVYDTETLRLKAELDGQNMATFYNYDQEGILVQVKKETAKGIVTLRTTRNNTNN